MEAVDAGDVPLGAVIEKLLSPDGLRELVGSYRAGCFVLARRVLVHDFFDQLIRNVDTIDETLRDNVAFIVFHGRESSLLTPPPAADRYRHSHPMGTPTQYRPGAPRRYHIDGLSISDDRYIDAPHLPDWSPKFDDEMMARIRQRDLDVPVETIAMVTERATNILMHRFGVAESQLPALLFVDGAEQPQHVLVPLDAADPMGSLYIKVLTPLADEFRRVAPYWKLGFNRGRAQQELGHIDHIHATAETSKRNLVAAEDAIAASAAPGDTDASVIAEATARLADMEARHAAFEAAETLDVRLDLVQPGDLHHDVIAAKRIALVALDRSHAELSAREDAAARRDEIVAIRQEAHRLRGDLGDLCKRSRAALETELGRRRVDPLGRVAPALFGTRDSAANWLATSKANLVRAQRQAPALRERIDAIDASRASIAAELREFGYDEAFIAGPRPNSIAVVRNLLERTAADQDAETALADGIDEVKEHQGKVLEGPWAKAGVALAGVGLIFAAIQVWPILFPGEQAVAHQADRSRTGDPPREARPASSIPARVTVTILDSERATRESIFRILSSDEKSDVARLGRIDEDWLRLAKGIGCRKPDVVVAHLHAFRIKKGGEAVAEDKLFPGLLAIFRHSKETRFILYSSTFGKADNGLDGAASRITTIDRGAILSRMGGIASRLSHDAETRADYEAMLANSTFVAWPLNASLRESNRQDLLSAVARAGKGRSAQRTDASPLCRF